MSSSAHHAPIRESFEDYHGSRKEWEGSFPEQYWTKTAKRACVKRLRALLEAEYDNINAMARDLRVHQRRIRRSLDPNGRGPSFDLLFAMRERFNLSLDYLITGEQKRR